jgi:hypothetical protein
VLGAVARIVVEVTAPGLVKTFAPWARFAIAELDGSQSPRLQTFCALLEVGGRYQGAWSMLLADCWEHHPADCGHRGLRGGRIPGNATP